MCCNEEKAETIEADGPAESTRQESADCCPCGRCPKNCKWVCVAGLAAALGFVAFRTLRRAAAS